MDGPPEAPSALPTADKTATASQKKQLAVSLFNAGEKDIETGAELVRKAQTSLLSLRGSLENDAAHPEATHQLIHALYLMVRPMLVAGSQNELDAMSEECLKTVRRLSTEAQTDLFLGYTQRFDKIRLSLNAFFNTVMEKRQLYGLGYPSKPVKTAMNSHRRAIVPKPKFRPH